METQPGFSTWTVPATLAESAKNGAVRCLACAHRCLIAEGKSGICKVRQNVEGTLQVPFGYTAGLAVDPIEKKPFSHFLPGTGVLTFGMLGCNFHCDFCQNWVSSQALVDPCNEPDDLVQSISASQIVNIACRSGAGAIASSYNEPIISAEWAYEVFRLAHQHNLKTVMISNGFASRDALEYLRPVMDGYKIDLKSMQDKHYREMGGRLQPVLDSIAYARELGYWVEVVTLVIPDYNDSPAELWEAASTIRTISADIPWHVTGYHPAYKRRENPATQPKHLQTAADIGQEAGLHFVYAGNLPGRVGSLENTYCPGCTSLVIERYGYRVHQNLITSEGRCPHCGQSIPGVWHL